MIKSQAIDQKNILVVEDHPLFRSMLVQLINMEADMTVTGETDNVRDAMILINKILPDLVITDLTLKESSGLELIKHIKTLSAEVKLLVISMHDEAIYSERILRAGARGYISKLADPSEVIKAIRNVLAGHIYLSQMMTERILEKLVQADAVIQPRNLNCLSDRELEVFRQIGLGLNSREIAAHFNVGISTVDSYRARIKKKLNIRNSVELNQQAGQWVVGSVV